MASYTDSPQAFLPQKTPFVDLNLYDAALQYKQTLYNQGVQRIQSSYDQVAGLDVARDVDKQYLQSKLGELTTQLNQVAGGDFSNQSMVAKAASLAPKMAKDVNIQNAVVSTQGIRNLSKSAAAMKAKHPELYPVQAEDWDNTQVRDYLGSTDLGKSYSGPTAATQYNNYNEPLMKMLKEKDPTVDMVVSPSGKWTLKYDKTSRVTPQEIESMVDGFFMSNPQYRQSQQIDAAYQFKGLDASGLQNKVGEFASTQYTQLYTKNKELEGQLKILNGNPYLSPALEKEMKSNAMLMNNLEKNVTAYSKMFKDGSPLSTIKDRIHMDQVRGMYKDLYEKDIHELDYKANTEAIESTKVWFEQQHLQHEQQDDYLKWIKQGVNPYTRQAITPADADLWNQYVNSNSEQFSRTSPEGKQTILVTPEGSKNSTGEYTDNTIDVKTRAIGSSLAEVDTRYRNVYAQSKSLTADAPTTKKQFADWCATNEDLVQHPEKMYKTDENGNKTMINHIDDNYLKYRSETRNLRFEKSTLESLKTKINNDAINMHPMDGGVNLDLPTYSRDGQNYNKLYVGFNSPAAEAVNDVIGAVDLELNKMVGQTTYGSSKSSVKSQNGAGLLATEIERYKDRPQIYSQLKALSAGTFSDWESRTAKITSPMAKVESERKAWKTKEYNTRYAARMNSVGMPINSEEEKTDIKGDLLAALTESVKDKGGKLPPADKIDPVLVYTGADGKPYIRYMVKDGSDEAVQHDVAVPAIQNKIGKPDPYDKMKSLIHMSWNGVTPTEGPDVWASDNGRLKFAIGESGPGAGPYNFYLIDGVKRIPINRTRNGAAIPYMSPGEILQQVEAMSKMVNPNTKQQYTYDEIVQLYNNPVTNEL